MEERVSVIKRKGKAYKLSYSKENDQVSIYLNDSKADNVWYDEKYKLYYSPFETEDGNFWVILFNKNLYMSLGDKDMRQSSFERNYIPKAYGMLFSIIYVNLFIVAPIGFFFYSSITKGAGENYFAYLIFLACSVFWFWLFRNIPLSSTKRRKKLCFISLIGTIIGFLVYFLEFLMP